VDEEDDKKECHPKQEETNETDLRGVIQYGGASLQLALSIVQ